MLHHTGRRRGLIFLRIFGLFFLVQIDRKYVLLMKHPLFVMQPVILLSKCAFANSYANECCFVCVDAFVYLGVKMFNCIWLEICHIIRSFCRVIKNTQNNTYVANALHLLCYLTNHSELSSVNRRYGNKGERAIAINSASKTKNYLIRNKSYYQTIDCNLFGANHLME